MQNYHEAFFITPPLQPIGSKNSINKHTVYSTVNLSNCQLTSSDYELLEKGLSFIPTKKTLPVKNLLQDRDRLIRTVKLKSHFKHKPNSNPIRKFIEPKNWIPPDYLLDGATVKLVDSINFTTDKIIKDFRNAKKINFTRSDDNRAQKDPGIFKLSDRNNLRKEENESMTRLRDNENIVIKCADKGGATVILNRKNYVFEAERQLNNVKYYKHLSKPIYTENIPKIRNILENMLQEKFISRDQLKYLSGPAEIKNRVFYLLPKIHKPRDSWPQPDLMPEGRPIVSDVNSETYRISEFIDHHINPLSTKHPSYLKNTYDFISKVKNFAIQNNYLLVTGDVTALYTNMNFTRSVEVVKKAFTENPDPARPTDQILELLKISLSGNDFEFNGKYYLQTMGTAMGKRFAPALANLYLLEFDDCAINNFHIKPILYFRYLDDIFFLWPGDLTSLKEFEIYLNTIIPDIKVTLDFSETEINFLDTTVYKKDNTLQTRVFFKPTDTHQLLQTDSFHPRHTFKGILRSQLIRYKRISSCKLDYDKTCKVLFASLKHRGYNHSEMRKQQSEIWFHFKEKNNENINSKDGILPIVMDFCDLGRELAGSYRKLLRGKLTGINPIVAYRNGKNLKNILVRSQLKSNKVGSFQGCGEANCKLCPSHSVNTFTFKSSSKNITFKIHENLTCKSKNLIYLVTCRKCMVQYVGETGNSLHDRFTKHFYCIRQNNRTPIGLHFNSPGHSFLDLQVTAIEEIKNTQNPTNVRKAREKFWQTNLCTFFPQGLNAMPVN